VTFDAFEAATWDAAEAAGLLDLATVALEDHPVPATAYVDFRKPDALVAGGMALSSEYAIEYRHGDLATLAEGNEIEIRGDLYRVREAPRVPDNGTGYTRVVALTKV
jgi:hypothetical protein